MQSKYIFSNRIDQFGLAPVKVSVASAYGERRQVITRSFFYALMKSDLQQACRVMFLSQRCLEQNGSDRRSASERYNFILSFLLEIPCTGIEMSLCIFLFHKGQKHPNRQLTCFVSVNSGSQQRGCLFSQQASSQNRDDIQR